MNKIYILHEYGAPSHYLSLSVLAKRKCYELAYYEFGNMRMQFKHWMLNPFKDRKFLLNLLFLLSLPFRKSSKIVVGIAPFDYRLYLLYVLLKKHQVYYHTSYTCWDGSFCAHDSFMSKYLLRLWKEFIERKVQHIFTVSLKSKNELIQNGYSSPERISVVNHSYNVKIVANQMQEKTNNFIYVGRLQQEKGIEELLFIFSKLSNADLMIVGKGPLQKCVEQYSSFYDNIKYMGYKENLSEILPLYMENSFLLLNSHRTKSWEELFGMAIIEGMSCGCVPIATNHSGPLEIIENGISGFICLEGRIEDAIIKALGLTNEEYNVIRQNTIRSGQQYRSEEMADRWEAIGI